ncbi:MAG: hypothetical protein JW714_01830 [Candidatus Omnitrophica bacterium]|nr:hypothetical protein [Candidatus Omnitrophota bacterium]
MKRILISGLVLSAYLICLVPLAGAEEITISTYYPAPYGVYNQMQANRMAVGDTNEDGLINSGDQPSENGQLYTARSVIYKPLTNVPVGGETEGELVYVDADSSDLAPGDFYYYGGGGWAKQGDVSGGNCYVQYNNNTSSLVTCPGTLTKAADLGVWGWCYLLQRQQLRNGAFSAGRPLSCRYLLEQL